MLTTQGMEKIARYIEGALSHAVIHSDGQQVVTPFYKKSVERNRLEVWIEVPDNLREVDKFQLIDSDGQVFAERSKILQREPGRVLIEVFKFDVRGVVV